MSQPASAVFAGVVLVREVGSELIGFTVPADLLEYTVLAVGQELRAFYDVERDQLEYHVEETDPYDERGRHFLGAYKLRELSEADGVTVPKDVVKYGVIEANQEVPLYWDADSVRLFVRPTVANPYDPLGEET